MMPKKHTPEEAEAAKFRKKEANKKWLEKNKEHRAAYKKEHYQKNKEHNVAYSRKYRQDHPEKIKEKRTDKYGITPEEYDRMYADQGGVCSICDEPMKKPCIDHNHTTGQVRELLCHPCNVSIGLMKEDIRRFQKAISYLEFHK